MLFRNRELGRALACAGALTLVIAALAWQQVNAAHWSGALALGTYVVGPLAALFVVVEGVALTVVFAVLTHRRYRAIARLAERVDAALHAGRTVSLADMREGELAILASEVDKALNRLNLTAEALAAEKRSLADSLADISHQIKTPLTSLGLTLELMRGAGDDATQALRIRTCSRLVEQVQWLVSALLKLARLDAGTIELRREPVDVERLVAGAAEPLAIAYDLADVRLERQVQPGAWFEGDEAWSREALENVLKNCLEHTPRGGTVRVGITQDALACRIRVQDTGPGIAAEDLPHVFERFYRGRGEDTSEVNPSGVGIGLSLAQALVTAQRGRVTASNAVDATGRVVGARFDITFFRGIV